MSTIDKMNPWIIKYLFVFIILFVGNGITYSGEFNIGNIIAYPNPFNPESDKLTIRPESGTTFAGTVDYTVYNFNERAVYSGTASNSAIYWSGHSVDGNRVKPGLYFVRIIQNRSDYTTSTGMVKVIIK